MEQKLSFINNSINVFKDKLTLTESYIEHLIYYKKTYNELITMYIPEKRKSFEMLLKQKEIISGIIHKLNYIDNDFLEKNNIYEFMNDEFVQYQADERFISETEFSRCYEFFKTLNENKVENEKSYATMLSSFLPSLTSLIENIDKKLKLLDFVSDIIDINTNIVVIGANGSGKSTISRKIRSITNNFTVLSAQKLLNWKDDSYIRIKGDAVLFLQKVQNLDKLQTIKDDFKLDSNDNLEVLKDALMEEYILNACKYYAGLNKSDATLLKLISYWNRLIKNRELYLSDNKIMVRGLSSSYSFSQLSDGEKTVFYYLGNVLLAKDNSHIIVDEPENHMNPLLAMELWNLLELERSDCKFVYLTHSVDFAISRYGCRFIWTKEYYGSDVWDYKVLEDNEELPKELLLRLLGSKKSILFCEGVNGGIDQQFYQCIFPEYDIFAVGGHKEVISSVRVFNKTQNENRAIGIIDNDYHNDEKISNYKKDGIYSNQTCEIENLICDNLILEHIFEHQLIKEKLDEYYKDFFDLAEKNTEIQANKYALSVANEFLASNLLTQSKDLQLIELEFQQRVSEIRLNEYYTKYNNLLKELIKKKDYNNLLKMVNLKKELTAGILNKYIKSYEQFVILFLRKNAELCMEIRTKYFNDIDES